MYIKFTYTDSSGRPVNMSQRYDAMRFPDIPGLVYMWDAQSEYPTDAPSFYGSCNDDASLPGGVTALTEAEYNAAYEAELDARRWLRVPRVVSARRGKLALIDAGHYQSVLSILESLPGDAGLKARVSWESAQEFNRLDPLVIMLLGQLGMTEAEGDELFIQAAQLAAGS